MTLIEYLDKIRRSRALTAAEIRILGLPAPLKHGWVKHYGNDVLSDEQVIAMRDSLKTRNDRRAERRSNKKEKCASKNRRGKPVSIPKPSLLSLGVDPASNEFLSTYEWRVIRMMALEKYGAICQCCGASPKTGAVMNVDHIKPRRLFPQFALDLDNLQILCHECNHGKGNWSQTDWRDQVEGDVVLQALDKINLVK